MDLSVDLLYAAFLGVIAGLIPVYLGILPWSALRQAGVSTRTLVTSVAIGILLFLFADVFHEAAIGAEGLGVAIGAPLLLTGLIIGLMSLTLYELTRSRKGTRQKGYHVESVAIQSARSRVTLAYLIALGIGIHNLGEGLAIGSAYASGEIALGYLLIVGFALHNGTEGFGIVAPVPKGAVRARDPILMGLVAGGPTIIGAIIGAAAYSTALSVVFFALAAGAILYVVIELTPIAYTKEHKHLVFVGVTIGLVAMYLTELLVG